MRRSAFRKPGASRGSLSRQRDNRAAPVRTAIAVRPIDRRRLAGAVRLRRGGVRRGPERVLARLRGRLPAADLSPSATGASPASCSAATAARPRSSVRWSPRTTRPRRRCSRAASARSTGRSISTSPTPRRASAPGSKRAALRRSGRSPACCSGASELRRRRRTFAVAGPEFGAEACAGPPSQYSFGGLIGGILIDLVEELVGVGRLDVVRLFDLEVFVDQLVVGRHALVVVPAERDGARGLVAHQDRHEVPVGQLVVVDQRAVRLDQRLDAGLRRLGAVGEGLLRDLDELAAALSRLAFSHAPLAMIELP